MLKALRNPRVAVGTIISAIVLEVLYWPIGLGLDRCCREAGNKVIDGFLANASFYFPYFTAAMIGAVVVVCAANLPRLINLVRTMARGAIKNILILKHNPKPGDGFAGVRATGPVDIENVRIQGMDTGIKLEKGAGSNLVNNQATGHGESIGYDIEDSPSTNLSGSKSRNNRVGYRLRRSGGSDLSNTSTEQDAETPTPSEGKIPKDKE